MTSSSVTIQLSPEAAPALPCWFGKVAIVAQIFKTSGLLQSIEQQVRFARRLFGTYEVLDFVVVLIGYAVSAESTLEAFYERLTPFAPTFMALFGRKNLPHRSTFSRFLAALDQPPVEALRALFLEDLVVRTAQTFPPGGVFDRLGHHWLVMDVDGTKQAARQRALPSLVELPTAHRRFDRACAPGYLGRKRGEVARTRTTVLAVNYADNGCVCFAHKLSRSPCAFLNRKRALLSAMMRCKLAHNERIGVSVGGSGWLAIPA